MDAERQHFLLPEKAYPSLAAYRAATGPSAVERARSMDPEAVLREVERSGLRGRGGAGFPTGTKWRTIKSHSCPTRFVVCNAAEGEPGTFKDRFLLRQNPYATLEGMLIAAHVVGTRQLYIGIKSSFTKEVARLRQAIEEMSRAGDTEDIEWHVVEGPEEYLFGEEKALLEVLSGNEPLPREADNPPFEVGLFPTVDSPNPALVNNVQTFAHVPSILRHGAASFREIGTEDSPGTILFTVSGDVRRPGVFERPAGITLRTLFQDLAGGPRPGRTFKAALSGVSAGVIPAEKFDTRADFASLHQIGSGLGSAGFMLYDDQASMPRVAQMAARFLYVESCNQCSACKHGLRTASQALDALFDPQSTHGDELARARFGVLSAPQANRCFLPVEGVLLLPSLMSRFRSEFEAQTKDGAPASERVPVPKIADFDEKKGMFILDAEQEKKRPDWTYEPTPPTEKSRMPVSPHDQKHARLGVSLVSDVGRGLLDESERRNLPVDVLVERGMREWLEKNRR